MPLAKGQTGFQPPARDAERRAFFDLLRRIKALEDAAPGGGGGDGADEVFIGPGDPGGTYELWYDTDAPSSGGGGGGGVASYVHNQGAVAATWVVVHNLGFFPNVVVEDSGGTTVEGEIVYNNANQVTLIFSAAFSGTAYLS